MTLLAGCYERFLFGYQYAADDQEGSAQLRRSFTHAAHKGVVKCAAAAGQYAATGGADDLIHLYDLKSDKDMSFLMSPGEGAVTALTFFTPAAAYNPSHLLSGSADGSISVWSVGGDWECMKTMRGHRKEVSSIAVHPSGMLALSVSRDCCLRMWDLVKGRCTYTVRLDAEAEAVHFCPADGARYALLCGSKVTLHSVQAEEGVLSTLDHPRRVLCMAWAPGNRIVTGSEDGSLRLWDAQAGVELLCINRAHASRVRCLALVPSIGSGSGSDQQALLVATGSSDGSMKLWDLTKAAAAGIPGSSGGACLGEAQTRARLTCMAAVDPLPVMLERLKAAAAARQAAAQQKAKAAAAAGQQQQQQQQAGKKRKAAAGQAAELRQEQQQQQAKKKKQGKEEQQAGGKGNSKQRAGAATAAGAQPADGEGVVVHDGVVEFLDSPQQQQKQKRKEKAVQQRRKQAAQQGKRFRSVPGEQHPQRPGLKGKSPQHRSGFTKQKQKQRH